MTRPDPVVAAIKRALAGWMSQIAGYNGESFPYRAEVTSAGYRRGFQGQNLLAGLHVRQCIRAWV